MGIVSVVNSIYSDHFSSLFSRPSLSNPVLQHHCLLTCKLPPRDLAVRITTFVHFKVIKCHFYYQYQNVAEKAKKLSNVYYKFAAKVFCQFKSVNVTFAILLDYTRRMSQSVSQPARLILVAQNPGIHTTLLTTSIHIVALESYLNRSKKMF